MGTNINQSRGANEKARPVNALGPNGGVPVRRGRHKRERPKARKGRKLGYRVGQEKKKGEPS